MSEAKKCVECGRVRGHKDDCPDRPVNIERGAVRPVYPAKSFNFVLNAKEMAALDEIVQVVGEIQALCAPTPQPDHKHAWRTCHGTTYCADCDATQPDPAEQRARELVRIIGPTPKLEHVVSTIAAALRKADKLAEKRKWECGKAEIECKALRAECERLKTVIEHALDLGHMGKGSTKGMAEDALKRARALLGETGEDRG